MDRVSSDTLETIRVRIDAVGSLHRPVLKLPSDAFSPGYIRISTHTETFHANIETQFSGDLEISGLYENPRLARQKEGTNHLPDWLTEYELAPGRSVLLDIITPGKHYGMRPPGERAVYQTVDEPADSLQSIAEKYASE